MHTRTHTHTQVLVIALKVYYPLKIIAECLASGQSGIPVDNSEHFKPPPYSYETLWDNTEYSYVGKGPDAMAAHRVQLYDLKTVVQGGYSHTCTYAHMHTFTHRHTFTHTNIYTHTHPGPWGGC